MEKTLAYIALGSNLGDRQKKLTAAMKLLDSRSDVTVLKVSNFLETKPVGGPEGQDMYLNAAAEIETTLTPQELLKVLHDIEAELGRDRSQLSPRGAPRTCDLDILLMGETVIDTDELTIPHPRMHERLFVLEPLAEIAPDAVHPVLKKTVSQLLGEAAGQ